jgi:hypothetical protein
VSVKLTTEEKTDPAVIRQSLESHFIPAINRKFERNKFNQIIQKDGECFMEFATGLECQAQKCTYGDLEDTLIADRIAVGIYNETVSENLLQKTMLILEAVKKICTVAESTSKQLKLMKSEKSVDDVVEVVKFSKNPNPKARSGEQRDRSIFCFVDDVARSIESTSVKNFIPFATNVD